MRAPGVLLRQRDHVGAGIDHEADRLAIHIGNREEVPAIGAIEHGIDGYVLDRGGAAAEAGAARAAAIGAGLFATGMASPMAMPTTTTRVNRIFMRTTLAGTA